MLSIDYRWFGDCEGEPRGRLHPLDEVEDFRNAITYLGSRPQVDAGRIGLWGTSFAGGIVLYTAALDRRAKAVVAQSPIVHGGRWLRSLRSAAEWEELRGKLEEDRRSRCRGGAPSRINLSGRAGPGEAAVMPRDDEQAAHFANLKRTQSTWREDITLESLEHVIDFRPIDVVPGIAPRASCIVTPRAMTRCTRSTRSSRPMSGAGSPESFTYFPKRAWIFGSTRPGPGAWLLRSTGLMRISGDED